MLTTIKSAVAFVLVLGAIPAGAQAQEKTACDQRSEETV